MSRKPPATFAHYDYCGTIMDDTRVGHDEPVAGWTKTKAAATLNFIQSR
jgi:hypothetical protein